MDFRFVGYANRNEGLLHLILMEKGNLEVKYLLNLLLACFTIFAGAADALDDWYELVPGLSPAGRHRHHMCYIAPDRALLFGGRLGVGGFADDRTFIFNIDDESWTLLDPATHPSARIGGAIASIGDDKALLFGGADESAFDDTWVYDLSESTWTLLTPALSPSARQAHKMAHAGDDRVVLFGGDAGSPDGQTWIYDLGDSAWTLQAPPIQPSARWDHDMASIGAGKIVLFGGHDGTEYLADTWIYDLAGNTWTEQAPPVQPEARYGHTVAHIGGDRAVLFGGRASGFLNDTWVYDLSDDQWIQDSNTVQPSPRYLHALSETSLDGSSRLVLFAGYFDIDDTWVFGGGDYLAPAPAAIADLTATLADSAIGLSWTAVTEDTTGKPVIVDHYTIYRSSAADFIPGAADSLAGTVNAFYIDTAAAVKDTLINHYYLVKAVDPDGRRSSDSNRVGEFDRRLKNMNRK